MPGKKKKGKSSKFARMSEEERARYVQHRIELELEAKRRKQQLIAIFTKNKLKREEAFSRLNTAKINEQWRFILRKIKCKELHEDVEYLMKNFDSTVKAKDRVIGQLYKELEFAGDDHKRFQELHIEAIDKLIGKYKERTADLHEHHKMFIANIEKMDVAKLNNLKKTFGEECKVLALISREQDNFLADRLSLAETRNSVNIQNMLFMKDEAYSQLKEKVGSAMEGLWEQLNSIILEYQVSTDDKRKQYEYLKDLDVANTAEAARNSRLIAQLQRDAEIVKDKTCKLSAESQLIIDDLRTQSCQLNDKMTSIRRETSRHFAKVVDKIKKSSVLSSSVIKNLQNTANKGATLRQLIKMCLEMELGYTEEKHSFVISNHDDEKVINSYGKLEKFWAKYNCVQADLISLRGERSQLQVEHDRIKRSLQIYLTTVAKKTWPKRRPHSST